MIARDPKLAEHLRPDFGDETERRLDALTRELVRLAATWDVEITGWLPGATCSLIFTGRRGEMEVVLRAPMLPWEVEASLPTMVAFSSCGGVPVLVADEATRTSLLPLLQPGTTLAEADLAETDQLSAWSRLVRTLRQAEGSAPPVTRYLEELPDLGDLPGQRPGIADDVRHLFQWLDSTSPDPILLHGDLHHGNVLRHGRQWLAIDPEGMLGDSAYEAAAYLRNPIERLEHETDLLGLTRWRIARLAEELAEPPERIWGWALVRNILSVPRDDPGRGHPWSRVAQTLDRLGKEFAPVALRSRWPG